MRLDDYAYVTRTVGQGTRLVARTAAHEAAAQEQAAAAGARVKVTVTNGYDNIRVSFKIKADASEAQLRELVELAQKRSPVFDIVSHPVPVTVELKGS